MAQNNLSNTDWTVLQQAEDMAYFRAEACLFSPESYSLEEKREICGQMDSTSKAIEEAMKKDFESLSPIAQSKMLDLLQEADPEHFEWWLITLLGEMPEGVDGFIDCGPKTISI